MKSKVLDLYLMYVIKTTLKNQRNTCLITLVFVQSISIIQRLTEIGEDRT